MLRDDFIKQIEVGKDEWDLVIIGGGASGLASAIEASTRGMKTLLLEQHDFSKGTSSRSTKLVHGGVRYLAQGNVRLVFEALRERGLLRKNAPHLVRSQPFLIPNYNNWGIPFYTTGLTIYDLMAGKLRFGASRPFSRKSTIKMVPTLKKSGLKGGVVYYDGQFDDSRLAVNMAQTFIGHGGLPVNYMKVGGLIKSSGRISGVEAIDMETGKEYSVKAKAVLNATGVFTDEILRMDDPEARATVQPSQGVHLVVDKEFLPGGYAIMIPKTSDGRVFFAVPWHNKVVLGTTDIKKESVDLEPCALEEEINFILEAAGQFLEKAPQRSDVRSVFAGLRPLAAPQKDGKSTKEISRGHRVVVSPSGMVTLLGGKWTTCRKMGEDAIDTIATAHGLKIKKSVTVSSKIHGFTDKINFSDDDPLYFYGSDKESVLKYAEMEPGLDECLSADLKILKAQVIHGVRNEMARTVEDILARRTRALFLDAKQSISLAPEVARLMSKELGRSIDWERQQAADFSALAEGYMLR